MRKNKKNLLTMQPTHRSVQNVIYFLRNYILGLLFYLSLLQIFLFAYKILYVMDYAIKHQQIFWLSKSILHKKNYVSLLGLSDYSFLV